MEHRGARHRITKRRYRSGYGGGWMFGYGGYFGDRDGDGRDDLTTTGNLGEQFDDVGGGFDGGGGGGE